MEQSQTNIDNLISDSKFFFPLRPDVSNERRFNTYAEVISFFDNEITFWRNVASTQPSEQPGLERIAAEFELVLSKIRQAGGAQNSEMARAILEQAQIEERAHAANLIYSESALGSFLSRLAQEDPTAANTAYSIHCRTFRLLRNVPWYQPSQLKGAVLLHVFNHMEVFESSIQQQRAAMQSSLQEISDLTHQQHALIDNLNNKIDEWNKSGIEILNNIEENAKLRFSSLHNTHETVIKQKMSEWEKNVLALEITYEQHLQLEKPAEYWKKLEDHYTTLSNIWIRRTCYATCILIALITLLLYDPPIIIQGKDMTLPGVRGALLATVGISALVYLVHLFVKLSTSAYHLSRDARERYQLTYEFLALSRDGKLDPSERAIILQSLFSRADTGLLRSDGSPSMPSMLGNISEIAKGK